MHLILAPSVLATALLAGILVIALLAAPWQLALGVTAGLAAVLGWHPSPDQPALLMLTMAATIVLLILPQFVPGRPPWRRTRSRPLFNQIWRMMTWADLHTCEDPPAITGNYYVNPNRDTSPSACPNLYSYTPTSSSAPRSIQRE